MVLSATGLGILVIMLMRQTPTIRESDYLHLGRNEVHLARGAYTFWWRTLSHPDISPDPEDFEIEVRTHSGASIETREPVIFLSRVADRSGRYGLFAVARMEVPKELDLSINVRIVGEVPPGKLVLLHTTRPPYPISGPATG